MMDKHPELRMWKCVQLTESERMLWGRVYNSPKFKDGDFIHTSPITQKGEFKEGGLVKTRNSVYLLGYNGGPEESKVLHANDEADYAALQDALNIV